MLKRILTLPLAIVLVSIVAASTVNAAMAAELFGQGNGNSGQSGYRQPAGATPGSAPGIGLPAASPGELTLAEIDGLLFMREEEKLAHDIYASLYQMWKLPLFNNISSSEQSHFEAIGVLIERYGLVDPAKSQVGEFANPDLQALYNELIARGESSLSDALKVGAAIEEIDILDLQERLTQTQNTDIQRVYQNLEQGSRNHLNAFVRTLSMQTGESYEPQYLSPDEYADIVSAPVGQGRGSRGRQSGTGQFGRP